jgi:hypothetical protein
MRRAPLASAVVCTLLCLSTSAAAKGPFPASNQIIFSPNDKNLVVLRTSYGILPSRDDGATWGYICKSALGLDPTDPEDPSLALTANNSLLAGTSKGLDVSTDVGCNWTCIKQNGLEGQPIADLVVRPGNPASAVAITKTYVQTDGGPVTTVSQVYETTDNGATWTPTGIPIASNFVVSAIDVAKGDPNRLYVAATDPFDRPTMAALFVSTNKGATWTKQVLPAAQFDPSTEDMIVIGAVDPNDSDRVYLRSSGMLTGGQSRLTVVTRASTTASFTTAKAFQVARAKDGAITGELLGFALSPDGRKVYVGSQEDGLWVASASDLAFTKKSSIIVQCLAARGDELWACSAAVSGFVAGVSTDDGAHFTPKMRLVGELTGPIACRANPSGAACNADQNASTCGQEFENFCSLYSCQEPDAGTTTNQATSSSSSSSSCSLSMRGIRRYGIGAVVCTVLALAGAIARRRRR